MITAVCMTLEGLTDLIHINLFEGEIRSEELHTNYFKKIYNIAIADIPLLLIGETGTSKGLMSKVIHNISSRRNNPFIEINCAAIPETLLESELFGVIANYPGLHNTEALVGKIKLANKGTIFLDEIGKTSNLVHAKLLKAIEDKKITPLGSKLTESIDVRFIAAAQPSNIHNNDILPDLLFRLSYHLNMPTLNERMKLYPELIIT